MTERNIAKKAAAEIKKGNERGARQALLEDLFYDFNRSRGEIYKMNFIRGIFFGLGSVIGGTVIIALVIWLMGFFVDIPGIGNSVEKLQNNIENTQKK
ncbi:MAG TPA: DUF5665 domain-containing protein [Candidatus Saccharimonadales bacterium]|nr:DUF5665 domain-containing protein [Candidatus Saccharimonadales bacterium]